MTQLFVGVILVAIVGNAAANSITVMTAMWTKMELALGTVVGASPQIKLLVSPISVFSSHLLGRLLDPIFTPFEAGQSRYLCWLSVLLRWSVSRTVWRG
ncbi:hypothetical protein [Petrachloros mirabilis]